MFDIAIVNASFHSSKAYIPVGPLLVSAVLEREGYLVNFLDYQLEKTGNIVMPETFAKFLENSQAKLIGISVFANSLPTVLLGVRLLKEINPWVKVILGGPAAADGAERLMQLAPIDVIVRGEGEITGLEVFSRLLQNDSLYGVLGITFRDNERIITNSERPLIKELARYPLPAYHHIDFKDYDYEASIIASRGCPYNCTFCAKPIWKYGVTYRSIDHVLEEMRSIYPKIERINFCDDAFVANQGRLIEFCNKFQKSGFTKPWECTGRVGHMNDQILQQIHSAGCDTLFLGIESGSVNVLRKMHKKFLPEQARKEIDIAKKYINNVYTSYIWGLPFEELEDFYETLFFIGEDLEDQKVKPVFTLATPLLSTQIYQDYKNCLEYLDNNHYCGVTLPVGYNLSDHSNLKTLVLENPDVFSGFYYYGHSGFEEKRLVIDKIRKIRKSRREKDA